MKHKYIAHTTRKLCDGKRVKTLVTIGNIITQAAYDKLPPSSQDCYWPVGMVELIDEIQGAAPDRTVVKNATVHQPLPPVDYTHLSNILPSWSDSHFP
jgi:hypothetical protein